MAIKYLKNLTCHLQRSRKAIEEYWVKKLSTSINKSFADCPHLFNRSNTLQ
ncbi:hypothetical protein GCHA_4689 [Paraglaciecola chathamensis S18K6]|uniref:Transposase n=1 Tax=Paraglaciecola chathamensis S18K6 TaxID=1127672 RepID=A0AAV3V751_9ALTE|nr:hypothetical protein GCHA_4689 [Paraglaciecola chathamensis S18K6]